MEMVDIFGTLHGTNMSHMPSRTTLSKSFTVPSSSSPKPRSYSSTSGSSTLCTAPASSCTSSSGPTSHSILLQSSARLSNAYLYKKYGCLYPAIASMRKRRRQPHPRSMQSPTSSFWCCLLRMCGVYNCTTREEWVCSRSSASEYCTCKQTVSFSTPRHTC